MYKQDKFIPKIVRIVTWNIMLLAFFRIRIRIKSEFSWVSWSDPNMNWESGTGSLLSIRVFWNLMFEELFGGLWDNPERRFSGVQEYYKAFFDQIFFNCIFFWIFVIKNLGLDPTRSGFNKAHIMIGFSESGSEKNTHCQGTRRFADLFRKFRDIARDLQTVFLHIFACDFRVKRKSVFVKKDNFPISPSSYRLIPSLIGYILSDWSWNCVYVF
jgi:hypothetical protein